MKIPRQILLVIFVISVTLSSFFAAFSHPVVQDDDSGQYDTIGWNIAQGRGFSLAQTEPFTPTMLREPLYPCFLAIVYKIFGHDYRAAIAFQIIFFALTCLAVYFIAKEIFDKRIAAYSAILTALCPTLANYPSYILTETTFTLLLCIFIFVSIKAVRYGKNALFIASGAILGICALCKAIMLPFSLIVTLFILLRRGMRQAALFIIIFMLMVSPWFFRNYTLFGTFQPSLRGGAALWERAQKSDDTIEDMKHAVVFNFSEYLGNKMFPGLVENPQDYILLGSKKSHDKEKELSEQGLTPTEIDKSMREEAKKNILAHPIKFLIYIPIESIKMTAFIYLPILNEPDLINRFSDLKNGNAMLSAIRSVFRLSAYPILLLVLIGIYYKRKEWKNWILMVGLIIYINTIYSMIFALGRYAVPIVPFYLIFAVTGLSCLFAGRSKINDRL